MEIKIQRAHKHIKFVSLPHVYMRIYRSVLLFMHFLTPFWCFSFPGVEVIGLIEFGWFCFVLIVSFFFLIWFFYLSSLFGLFLLSSCSFCFLLWFVCFCVVWCFGLPCMLVMAKHVGQTTSDQHTPKTWSTAPQITAFMFIDYLNDKMSVLWVVASLWRLPALFLAVLRFVAISHTHITKPNFSRCRHRLSLKILFDDPMHI